MLIFGMALTLPAPAMTVKRDTYGGTKQPLPNTRYIETPEISIRTIERDSYIIASEPRVPGTTYHYAMKIFLVTQLEEAGMDVDTLEFEAPTPHGTKTFKNIVAHFPEANKPGFERPRLYLSAHYDSKWYPDPNQFVGATDSAVPCAMILELARVMKERSASEKAGFGIIFFDGEEAFEEWTDTDSMYGSRRLASDMEADGSLRKIGLLVLLDILGADVQVSRIPFQRMGDQKRHQRLVDLEKTLVRSDMSKVGKGTRIFQSSQSRFYSEDDHIPFYRKGVPVLHVCGSPFPKEWHTPKDNLELINFDVVHDITAVLATFLTLDPLITNK